MGVGIHGEPGRARKPLVSANEIVDEMVDAILTDRKPTADGKTVDPIYGKGSEVALMVNGLFFANPRSSVQLYGIAGVGFGAAFLDSGVAADGLPVLRDETYSYTGGQLGFGVEGRVTRHFALGADLIGFLRWRNDRHAADNPEFVDPATLRSTNTSGGGLLRLGMTFYW